jgi:hypothetical protein
MSKISRLVVLVTALASLLAVTSSTAGAVTWINGGTESFHATGLGGTLSHGINSLVCTDSTLSGTAPVTVFGDPYKITGTLKFTPCTIGVQNTYMHCGVTFTGTSITGPRTFGTFDTTCEVRVETTNAFLCHVDGSPSATYTNPEGGNPGVFTVQAGTLKMTVSGGSCPLGTGASTLTEQTLTMTAGGPNLFRTS